MLAAIRILICALAGAAASAGWPAARAAEQGGGAAAALAALLTAYPDHLAAVEGNDLVWTDGTRMAIDDGRGKKPFEALLETPDIDDQFYAAYPLGAKGFPPDVDIDPGRVRHEPLFAKMYGDCRKGEVTARLVRIAWLPMHGGGAIDVTKVNGVDRALSAVSAELDKLPDTFMKYLLPSAGAYSCRVIAGTDRPSVHAWGAAIDINVAKSHYWRWAKHGADGRYAYRNAIPIEIVEIFERHGFIWGGKWYHYDTMHFEYRPELIALAREREGKTSP